MIPTIDARLVAKMRAAQREYYRTKNKRTLEIAEALEIRVDRAILDATRQPRLPFDKDPTDAA